MKKIKFNLLKSPNKLLFVLIIISFIPIPQPFEDFVTCPPKA